MTSHEDAIKALKEKLWKCQQANGEMAFVWAAQEEVVRAAERLVEGTGGVQTLKDALAAYKQTLSSPQAPDTLRDRITVAIEGFMGARMASQGQPWPEMGCSSANMAKAIITALGAADGRSE